MGDVLQRPSPKSRLMAATSTSTCFSRTLYFDDADAHNEEYTFFRTGALAYAERCSPSTRSRRGARSTTQVTSAFYYRLLRRDEHGARQDAHALRAERTAHGALACAVSRRPPTRSRRCRRTSRGWRPIRSPPFTTLPVRVALSLHARRGRVHPDGLHQGPGVSRARSRSTSSKTASGSPSSIPMSAALEHEARVSGDALANLDLPAEEGSNAACLTWLRYARTREEVPRSEERVLEQARKTPAHDRST